MRQVLQPLFDQLVIQEVDPPDMRQSGLLVPATMHQHQPPQEGIILAVGGGLDWWEHAGFKMPVKVGDHVMFPWQAGTYVELNEERLLVLRVGQLLGVVQEVREHALSDTAAA